MSLEFSFDSSLYQNFACEICIYPKFSSFSFRSIRTSSFAVGLEIGLEAARGSGEIIDSKPSPFMLILCLFRYALSLIEFPLNSDALPLDFVDVLVWPEITGFAVTAELRDDGVQPI